MDDANNELRFSHLIRMVVDVSNNTKQVCMCGRYHIYL